MRQGKVATSFFALGLSELYVDSVAGNLGPSRGSREGNCRKASRPSKAVYAWSVGSDDASFAGRSSFRSRSAPTTNWCSPRNSCIPCSLPFSSTYLRTTAGSRFSTAVAQIGQTVGGLGGNPASILPSPKSGPQPQNKHLHEEHERRIKYIGKVVSILYDRYGAFEGFVLNTERGRGSSRPRGGHRESRISRVFGGTRHHGFHRPR
jgi:hypothetical protein